MTREEIDFWKVVYAAAIFNGHSPNVAKGLANDAVNHLRDVSHE